jgi:hypothetical protein
MYSFQPQVDTLANTHMGFYAVCVILVVIAVVVVSLFNDYECSGGTMLIWLVCLSGIGFIGYKESFRAEKIYDNTPVTATLVGFQPEGYNEKSGKSRADRHYMYVVYDVSGEHVILRASEGVTYPKTTTLYKN